MFSSRESSFARGWVVGGFGVAVYPAPVCSLRSAGFVVSGSALTAGGEGLGFVATRLAALSLAPSLAIAGLLAMFLDTRFMRKFFGMIAGAFELGRID